MTRISVFRGLEGGAGGRAPGLAGRATPCLADTARAAVEGDTPELAGLRGPGEGAVELGRAGEAGGARVFVLASTAVGSAPTAEERGASAVVGRARSQAATTARPIARQDRLAATNT